MLQTIAKQSETLDEILYRTHGNSAALAQIINLNPHALTPRLAAGTLINIPTAQPHSPARIHLW